MSSTETIAESFLSAFLAFLQESGYRSDPDQRTSETSRTLKLRRNPLRPPGLDWLPQDLPPEVIRYTVSGGIVWPMGSEALSLLQTFVSTSKALRKLRHQQARRDKSRKRAAA